MASYDPDQARIFAIMESQGMLDPPREKKYWVHPFHADRGKEARFQSFYSEIRKHSDKFFEYYRMSIGSFDELLNIIRPHITRQNTSCRDAGMQYATLAHALSLLFLSEKSLQPFSHSAGFC
jgi:hypothetical protein